MQHAEAPVTFVASGDVNELQYYVGVAVDSVNNLVHYSPSLIHSGISLLESYALCRAA